MHPSKMRRPIWASSHPNWLTSIIKWALRPIDYSWNLATIQGISIIVASYFYEIPPYSIGIASIVLALVAVVMTIRAEEKWSRTERILWFVLALLLGGTEIRTIQQDTFRRDQQESADRKTEREEFTKILQQNQKQFETSLQEFAQIGRGEKENVDAVTGGESYAVVTPILVPINGQNTFRLTAWLGKNRPKHRLSNVRIIFRKMPIATPDVTSFLKSGQERDLIFSGELVPDLSQLLDSTISPEMDGGTTSYFVNVSAQNKPTIETLKVQYDSKTGWHYSFVVSRELGNQGKYEELERTSPEWRGFLVK